MVNNTVAQVGCVGGFGNSTAEAGNSTAGAGNFTVETGCAAAGEPPDWDISRVMGGIILSVIIESFSAPPAAVIWRTPSLHRVSYLYVMALSLLDCLLGVIIFTMALAGPVLGSLLGGIPCWFCVLVEAVTNGCMNTVNGVMLALGRDRYLSLSHALTYPLLATPADVQRHVKMAAAYGALHAAIFVGARVYYGCEMALQRDCVPLHWLLSPEYRAVAVVTVFNNIFLDVGTIVYNGCVMYWAWKLNRKQVHPQDVDQHAQQKQHMRIFIFTFKLACLFLVCSLPYKLAILLYSLGVHSSVSLIEVLTAFRMMYYIFDGWTFCTNEELSDAVKVMFRDTFRRPSDP